MATRISFNQWLTLQVHGSALGLGDFAKRWVTSRGRLTRESVEARAHHECGQLPGVGAAAYDSYCQAIGLPTAPVTITAS
jgi:hypothetical protein